MENKVELVSSVLLSMYHREWDRKYETCQDNDEFKLISRTCVVIYYTVVINDAVDYNGVQLNVKII
jgi:hypothetical protein